MIINKFLKLIFILVWAIIFYNILFNTLFQDTLLIYSNKNIIFAPLLLIGMQIILASFILPCSGIAVLAGILWGVEIGILYSLLADSLGSRNWYPLFFACNYMCIFMDFCHWSILDQRLESIF